MSRFLLPVLFLLPALLPAADAPQPRERPGYQEVTATRIARLEGEERAAWTRYLEESQRLAAADLAVLAEEKAGSSASPPPPATGTPRRLQLNRPAAWYGEAEARELAARVVSYQTPAGGWNKANAYLRSRAPGEEFGREPRYRGTIDNGATVTELRFLALVAAADPGPGSAPFRAAFERGVRYLLAAQFPNGGWPQVYPLTGDYHDAVTFNDDATVNLLRLLREIADGREAFAFVSPDLREAARRSRASGVACILRAQVRRDGVPAGWGQQHDPFTLLPCAARAYEMASLSSSESAGLALFLLAEPAPDDATVAAIEGAAAWFERTAIRDSAYRDTDGTGRKLVAAPGEGPWWARMIDLNTDRPVFGDRDYTVHATLDTVSAERRRGYAWYSNRPAAVLKAMPAWRLERTGARK